MPAEWFLLIVFLVGYFAGIGSRWYMERPYE